MKYLLFAIFIIMSALMATANAQNYTREELEKRGLVSEGMADKDIAIVRNVLERYSPAEAEEIMKYASLFMQDGFNGGAVASLINCIGLMPSKDRADVVIHLKELSPFFSSDPERFKYSFAMAANQMYKGHIQVRSATRFKFLLNP